MSDEYACVSKSKLKLKNDSGIKKKKKKNKDKEKERDVMQHAIGSERSQTSNSSRPSAGEQRPLTKAEMAFKQQQEKMRNKRIMEKATTTHKERVEKFNEHLDTLTEHFDIPKVSWTK